MTRAHLSKILYDLNVPPHLYRLDGTHSELTNVIAQRDSHWVVFLSERGGESGPVEFQREHDACVFLLGRICRDLIDMDMLRVIEPSSDPTRSSP